MRKENSILKICRALKEHLRCYEIQICVYAIVLVINWLEISKLPFVVHCLLIEHQFGNVT